MGFQCLASWRYVAVGVGMCGCVRRVASLLSSMSLMTVAIFGANGTVASR